MVGFRGESDITVGEDAGTIMIPVTLSQLIAQTVTVDYSIRGITAVEGGGLFLLAARLAEIKSSIIL